jgi:hypothetical protein
LPGILLKLKDRETGRHCLSSPSSFHLAGRYLHLSHEVQFSPLGIRSLHIDSLNVYVPDMESFFSLPR